MSLSFFDAGPVGRTEGSLSWHALVGTLKGCVSGFANCPIVYFYPHTGLRGLLKMAPVSFESLALCSKVFTATIPPLSLLFGQASPCKR